MSEGIETLKLIYNIGVRLYGLGILMASWFLPKAKLWVNGRKTIYTDLKKLEKRTEILIWVHCASLGEFEQARPLIEKIKAECNALVLLSFFSPSGFEIRKNYALADAVVYMPLDTPQNAKKFIESIKPDAVYFIKYEFWLNHLNELKSRNIPSFLVSGLFRKKQPFFKWYGYYFRKSLSAFNHFFLQDIESSELLKSLGFNNYTVCGDTRFDRVIQIANEKKELPQIRQFKNDGLLVVCGSTWPVDEAYLLKIIAESPKNVKWIFAPHQIHHAEIQKLTQIPNINTVLYSAYSDIKNLKEAQLLVIDSIGLLSSVYAYADIAYVGGGFGKAVHNTAEPAVYGIPVVFGPKHKKFKEAIDLMMLRGAFAVSNAEILKKTITELIENPSGRADAGKKAKAYISQNSGAVEVVWKMTQMI